MINDTNFVFILFLFLNVTLNNTPRITNLMKTEGKHITEQIHFIMFCSYIISRERVQIINKTIEKILIYK